MLDEDAFTAEPTSLGTTARHSQALEFALRPLSAYLRVRRGA